MKRENVQGFQEIHEEILARFRRVIMIGRQQESASRGHLGDDTIEFNIFEALLPP